jgi:transcriptional regulator with XRE-family HTH domain
MGRSATETFGKRIRLARLEAGISRATLARRMAVSERAVAYWEDDEKTPRAEYYPRLAEATGKPVSWFFEEVAA